MRLPGDIPAAWREALTGRLDAGSLARLAEAVNAEREHHAVFPPEGAVFRALELTPPEAVKVMILGQDPYHDDGQAHGLAFSVPEGVKPPPSLRNLYRELADDFKSPVPTHGDLSSWARAGVLLLNSVLTVRAHAPGSHRKFAWEAFTDAVLDAVNAGPQPVVFILWGAYAQAKAGRIDAARHRIIESCHPSPLSAHRGFFGSRPFSRANTLLAELGREPVAWQLESFQGEFQFQ